MLSAVPTAPPTPMAVSNTARAVPSAHTMELMIKPAKLELGYDAVLPAIQPPTKNETRVIITPQINEAVPSWPVVAFRAVPNPTARPRRPSTSSNPNAPTSPAHTGPHCSIGRSPTILVSRTYLSRSTGSSRDPRGPMRSPGLGSIGGSVPLSYGPGPLSGISITSPLLVYSFPRRPSPRSGPLGGPEHRESKHDTYHRTGWPTSHDGLASTSNGLP